MATKTTIDPSDIEKLMAGGVEEADKIKVVEALKATEIFGDKARSPDRNVLQIITEKGAREAHSIPLGIDYVDGDYQLVDKMAASRSLMNSNSWFSRYYRRYHDFPRTGQAVRVNVGENGFLQVLV